MERRQPEDRLLVHALTAGKTAGYDPNEKNREKPPGSFHWIVSMVWNCRRSVDGSKNSPPVLSARREYHTLL